MQNSIKIVARVPLDVVVVVRMVGARKHVIKLIIIFLLMKHFPLTPFPVLLYFTTKRRSFSLFHFNYLPSLLHASLCCCCCCCPPIHPAKSSSAIIREILNSFVLSFLRGFIPSTRNYCLRPVVPHTSETLFNL